MQKPPIPHWYSYALLVLGLGLLALRFFHLPEAIDEPHSWRQCDTAYYIEDFRQNGIDLLHPAVCWMGPYRTLALEFPLPEAIAALADYLPGPKYFWIRITFLAFFLVSAWYLYRIVLLLSDAETALLSVLVYMGLPLSQFYSRAIHIDFFAIACGLAGWYYLEKEAAAPRARYLAAAVLSLTLAALVKAPYLAPLVPVAIYRVWRQGALWPRWRRWLWMALPLVAFLWWRGHTTAVNGAAPDWDFIPGYVKFTDMSGWYFGKWHQRFEGFRWAMLAERSYTAISSPPGLLLLGMGLFAAFRRRSAPGLAIRWWLLGLTAYLLLFFTLNDIHDYYQLPFLPLVAIGTALGLGLIGQRYGRAWSLAALLLVSGWQVWQAERQYYEVKELYEQAARWLEGQIPPGELALLASPNDDCRSPLMLARAQRSGWALNSGDVDTTRVARYRAEGALWLGVLAPDLPWGVAPLPARYAHIRHDSLPDGWKIWLFDLRRGL